MDQAQQEWHIDEGALTDWVVDGRPLTDAETGHLAGCAECQANAARTRQLLADLDVYRHSAVSEETLARYTGLLAQVRGARPSLLSRIATWIQGQLIFDSRSQMLAAGVRSANMTTYRLVYAAGETELEMLVEADNGRRSLVGEVLGPSEETYFIQLTGLDQEAFAAECETSTEGAFRFDALRPGRYRLDVSSTEGIVLSVAELTLE